VFGLKKCIRNKKFSTKAEKAWHRVFVTLIRYILDGLGKEEQLESTQTAAQN
jgi:hypothetical protein